MGRTSSARVLMVTVVVVVVVAVMVQLVAGQARPPRCPPDTTRDNCTLLKPSNNNGGYEFTVQGHYFGIEYVDGKYLRVTCESGLRFERRSMPRFETQLSVAYVAMVSCPVANYTTLFRELNVGLLQNANLTLDYASIAPPSLAAIHLAGLSGLRSLVLRNAGALSGPLLSNLPELVQLIVHNTILPRGELDAPPSSLVFMRLMNTSVNRVPAAVLALPYLRSLIILEKDVVQIERPRDDASQLRYLDVGHADKLLFTEWAPPALETVYLRKWRAESPTPVPACEALTSLTVVESTTLKSLPAGWVARCPHLDTLQVRFARKLSELPANLLANASSLTRLVFTECALTSLPPHLFNETPLLAYLDLRNNHIAELPSGLLVEVSGSLLELNLSSNNLTENVASALTSLVKLRDLSLANNTQLHDLCAPQTPLFLPVNKNKSLLSKLSNLKKLNLKETKVTTICLDWRIDLQNLTELDLRKTLITSLSYDDFVYIRREPAQVLLTNVPLQDVFFTADNYDAAVNASRRASPLVTVALGRGGSNLTCDCYLYWLARALHERLLPSSGDLSCAGGGHLSRIRPDDLLCRAPAGACPALPRRCTCGVTGELRHGVLLSVRCVGAGLTRVPRLPALTNLTAVDLRLADNSVIDLTENDIPLIVRVFDLRNNSIERIDEATALRLVGNVENHERHVMLSGNRLDCGCELASARRVLRAGAALLDRYEALRCADDTLLAGASDVDCAAMAPALVVSLAGVAAAAALVGVTLAARRRTLRRFKTLLRRLGWAPRPAATPEDASRPFDAFVTFGRGDEAAALELTAQLERGKRRVCLQERDWLPPAWVPHCIEVSVGAARRTVALVSSEWQRSLENGEVRAAYEPAWRRGALVLVLPAPPAAAAPAPASGATTSSLTDATLRRYAREFPHLVLRRNERDFWGGLEFTLPPPSTLASARAPAPAPEPV